MDHNPADFFRYSTKFYESTTVSLNYRLTKSYFNKSILKTQSDGIQSVPDATAHGIIDIRRKRGTSKFKKEE